MKSLLKNLSLLSMGLLIYSCNEKISAELQDGNSTTVPTIVAPSEYYFKITNDNPVVLNYVLHRSGAGRYGTNKWDCKISTTGVEPSSDLFISEAATAHENKNYDISCFFDTEELALDFNGLSFKVEASKNTCEYIAYSPYSYFDAIPGSSSTTYRGVICDTTAGITNAHGNARATIIGATYNGTPVDCGYMVDINVPEPDRQPVLIPDEKQPLCQYDYSELGGGNGQNCDTGRIKFQITEVYNAETDTTLPANPQPRAVATSDHLCGGSPVSCVGGAIKHVPSLSSGMYGTLVTNTNQNQDFSTQYKLPATLTRAGNYDIVNYRRGLASLNLNFGDYTVPNEVQWGDATYNKAFDPHLMEMYSVNMDPAGNPIIDTAGGAPASLVDNTTYDNYTIATGVTRKPYAADPFLGINGARVNPFYTFYCLDRAYEVKARIRMVVRDWDRIFPSTTADLELISDVHKLVNARRQDLPGTEMEIPNDPGVFNLFNDQNDWDVLVPMTRIDPNLVGVYDPGFTFWGPTAGFWDPASFPSLGPVGASSP